MNIEIKVIDVRKPRVKVGLYARTLGGESRLDSQIHRMVKFADANSLEVTDLVSDRGSAVDIDRVEIEALLQGLELGKYDSILITSLDRITSDEEDASGFLKRVNDLLGNVYSLEQDRRFIDYDTGY